MSTCIKCRSEFRVFSFPCEVHKSLCNRCIMCMICQGKMKIFQEKGLLTIQCKCKSTLEVDYNIFFETPPTKVSDRDAQENDLYCSTCAASLTIEMLVDHKNHLLYSKKLLREKIFNQKNLLKNKTFQEIRAVISDKKEKCLFDLNAEKKIMLQLIDQAMQKLIQLKFKVEVVVQEKLKQLNSTLSIHEKMIQFYLTSLNNFTENSNFEDLIFLNKQNEFKSITFKSCSQSTKNTIKKFISFIDNKINDFQDEELICISYKKRPKFNFNPKPLLKTFKRCMTVPVEPKGVLKCTHILNSHSDCIYHIIQLVDDRLASCSSDKKIIIWNSTTYKPDFILKGHKERVNCLTQTDPGTLVSCSADYTIKLWDLVERKLKSTLTGHGANISSVISLPENKIASSSWDSTIKIWDLSDLKEKFTLQAKANSIGSLVYINNNKLCSNIYKSIVIWNLQTKKQEGTLQGHEKCINVIFQLHNHNRIASGGDDKTIRVWDLIAKKCLYILSGHEEPIYCLTESPEGKLVSGSQDKTIRVWNTETKTLESTFVAHSYTVRAVLFLRDKRLCTGSWDASIKIWEK